MQTTAPPALRNILCHLNPASPVAGARISGSTSEVAVKIADPRELSNEQLRAVCTLWFLEDGDFCAAERVGNFSSRPASIDAIVESREQHNALPDGIYGSERWHIVMEGGSGGAAAPPVCLAIARSFVREW